MKHISTLILLLFCGTVALQAQPLFEPGTLIQKVGEVIFQQPKRIVFPFTNKGDQPLRITEIHPSCGCVKVTFPQDEIPAGQGGEIVMTYDAGILGTFYKDLEVLTNASAEPVYLAAEGIVVSQFRDTGEQLPIDLGNVRLLSNYIEFDDVNKGEQPEADIKVQNADRTAYRPELMHLPPYLSAQYLPQNIAPGKTGIIRLTLDSSKLPQMGLTQTSIYLSRYMGDKIGEKNEILVSAVLLPSFSGMTEAQLSKAPELYVTEPQLNLGSMNGKEKLSHTILLMNMGKTPLNIKQVQVFNKALAVSLSNRTIQPGKSAKLKVTVSRSYLLKAKNRPRVLLISDDPRHAKEVIDINVEP